MAALVGVAVGVRAGAVEAVTLDCCVSRSQVERYATMAFAGVRSRAPPPRCQRLADGFV